MTLDRIKIFLAQWAGTWLATTIARTLRYDIEGDAQLAGLADRYGAIVFCGWHNRLLVPLFHHRHVGGGHALVSEHTDGELVGRVLQNWGYTLLRGSTTHGAVRLLIQAVKVMRAGHSLGITPDGPRGPRYVAQAGTVALGQMAQCPIVPMGFATRWFWRFKSWDRFEFPKPWSRAAIRYGEPILVPRKLTEEEAEHWRLRVQDGLMKVTRDCEAAVGLAPEPSDGGSDSPSIS